MSSNTCMPRAARVKVAEFLLSVPIAAVIVWFVWFGFMEKYFAPGAMIDETAFYEGTNAHLHVAPAHPAVHSAGVAGAGALAGVGAGGSSMLGILPPAASGGQDAAAAAGAGGLGAMVAPGGRAGGGDFTALEQRAIEFMARNSTRKQLGHLLTELGLRGEGVEIGTHAARGSFPAVLLSTWAGGSRGRVDLVTEYVEDAVGRFPNDHFAFVYINPTSSSRGLKKHLEDWFPKLRDGGVFAGKDYCACHSEKSGDLAGRLARRPWCGTYHSGSKRGKEKAGFGKFTVAAVDSFAEEVGRRAFFTLEGRLPEDPHTSDGLANPSWWLIK